jgi:hypothetical protein
MAILKKKNIMCKLLGLIPNFFLATSVFIGAVVPGSGSECTLHIRTQINFSVPFVREKGVREVFLSMFYLVFWDVIELR